MTTSFSFQREEKLGRTLELDEESADRRGQLSADAAALGVLDVELSLASCQELCVLTALAWANLEMKFHHVLQLRSIIYHLQAQCN